MDKINEELINEYVKEVNISETETFKDI